MFCNKILSNKFLLWQSFLKCLFPKIAQQCYILQFNARKWTLSCSFIQSGVKLLY